MAGTINLAYLEGSKVDIGDVGPGTVWLLIKPASGAAFRGWMLASAPALSLMEHPIYDVRVTSCH